MQKNGQYMESVAKEIQERCRERGEEFPYDAKTNLTKISSLRSGMSGSCP